MRVVLVGEAWGQRENQFKHALVGPSGRELTYEMGKAGLAPYMTILCQECKTYEEFVTGRCPTCNNHLWPNEYDLIRHWKHIRDNFGIAITNVFNEQPPNNNLGYFFGPDPETNMPRWKASKSSPGTHLKREFLYHINNLYEEIETLKPNLVIAMGNAACWALLQQSPKISDLRGYVDWSERLSVKVLPTYHAAYVLRNQTLRTTCIADYRKAKIEATFPEIRRPERWILQIDPTPEGIRAGYEWFSRPATSYANDIETWYNLISIVGFARSPSDSLVVVFRNSDNPTNPNYWPTPELEFEAWKLVIHGLETKVPKIYQNGVFDISHFLRMGIMPRNVTHDTMLWHHAWLPELPKSLGYLGSIYISDVAWKRMRRRETLKRDK